MLVHQRLPKLGGAGGPRVFLACGAALGLAARSRPATPDARRIVAALTTRLLAWGLRQMRGGGLDQKNLPSSHVRACGDMRPASLPGSLGLPGTRKASSTKSARRLSPGGHAPRYTQYCFGCSLAVPGQSPVPRRHAIPGTPGGPRMPVHLHKARIRTNGHSYGAGAT